jgi:hypothetical protein
VKPVTRRRLLWFVAIAGTAAAVAWVDGSDDEVITAAGAHRPGGRNGERQVAAKGAPLVLHLEQLEARDFEDVKSDLFAAKSWYVAPPVVAQKPKPPPLPFTYFGRLIEDGRTTVFLVQQGRNQFVRLGDLIEKTWRVDDISATSMTLTYLPLNERQSLALGAAP